MEPFQNNQPIPSLFSHSTANYSESKTAAAANLPDAAPARLRDFGWSVIRHNVPPPAPISSRAITHQSAAPHFSLPPAAQPVIQAAQDLLIFSRPLNSSSSAVSSILSSPSSPAVSSVIDDESSSVRSNYTHISQASTASSRISIPASVSAAFDSTSTELDRNEVEQELQAGTNRYSRYQIGVILEILFDTVSGTTTITREGAERSLNNPGLDVPEIQALNADNQIVRDIFGTPGPWNHGMGSNHSPASNSNRSVASDHSSYHADYRPGASPSSSSAISYNSSLNGSVATSNTSETSTSSASSVNDSIISHSSQGWIAPASPTLFNYEHRAQPYLPPAAPLSTELPTSPGFSNWSTSSVASGGSEDMDTSTRD